MNERWYMLLHTNDDSWSWCVVNSDGIPPRCAELSFARYIDAYEDARRHGCVGTPRFARPGDTYNGEPLHSFIARSRAKEMVGQL